MCATNPFSNSHSFFDSHSLYIIQVLNISDLDLNLLSSSTMWHLHQHHHTDTHTIHTLHSTGSSTIICFGKFYLCNFLWLEWRKHFFLLQSSFYFLWMGNLIFPEHINQVCYVKWYVNCHFDVYIFITLHKKYNTCLYIC